MLLDLKRIMSDYFVFVSEFKKVMIKTKEKESGKLNFLLKKNVIC